MDLSNLTAAASPSAVYTPALKSAVTTQNIPAATTAPATSVSPSSSTVSNKKTLDELNAEIRDSNPSRDLDFSVDHDSGMTVVRVVDSNTKEVVAQFPAEVVVRIAHALTKFKGTLVNDSA